MLKKHPTKDYFNNSRKLNNNSTPSKNKTKNYSPSLLKNKKSSNRATNRSRATRKNMKDN